MAPARGRGAGKHLAVRSMSTTAPRWPPCRG